MPILPSHILRSSAATTRSPNKTWNENSSQALFRSLWATKDGTPNPLGQISNDMALTGYTSEGLPFLITVRANSLNRVGHFFETEVLSQISQYSADLVAAESSADQNSLAVTDQFINGIRLQNEANDNFEFSFSFAVTYQTAAGQYRLAGCDIGQPGVMIKPVDGPIKKLRPIKKLTSDSPSQYNFDQEISEGALLFGYTYLPEEIVKELKNLSDSPLDTHRHSLIEEDGFFEQFERKISLSFTEQCETAKSNARNSAFGADCIIACIQVPNREQKLKFSELCAIKGGTEDYLKWSTEHAKGHRFLSRFSHFFHGSSGRERARTILSAINDGSSYEDIQRLVNLSISKSSKAEHSYRNYITRMNQALPEDQVINEVQPA